MARMHGTSGAFTTLLDEARAAGVPGLEEMTTIEECERHLEWLVTTLDQRVADERERRQVELRRRREAWRAYETSMPALMEEIRAAGEERMADARRWIERLGAESTNPVLWLFNLPLLLWKRWTVRRAERWMRRRQGQVEVHCKRLADRYQSARDDLEPGLARHQSELEAQNEAFRKLLGSPQAIGARGEFEVIDHLAGLPHDYVVLNDLTLRDGKYRTFQGEPLMSAQMDHVVVGPTGVFVVETKCWTRERFLTADFDPFEQVSRAGNLCWKYLNDARLDVRVKQILACAGHRPHSPVDSFVKVRRVARVCALIERYDHVLSDEDVDRVVRRLQQGAR